MGNIPVDENKINSQYLKLIKANMKSSQASGKDVSDIKHQNLGTTGKADSPMKSPIMNFTQMLESLNNVLQFLCENDEDIMTDQTGVETEAPVTEPTVNDDEIIAELNKIFTPILVMQKFESETSDQAKTAMSEANVLTEQNIIKFDDKTRMSQLIATCALLIAKHKNSPEFQTYQKAHLIRQQAKLDIQKKEYDAASALAQKYLVSVSTTNNSSAARDAANALLPETQH